jgi:hypothetical protein
MAKDAEEGLKNAIQLDVAPLRGYTTVIEARTHCAISSSRCTLDIDIRLNENSSSYRYTFSIISLNYQLCLELLDRPDRRAHSGFLPSNFGM